jgi:hypothetical protein
MCDKNELYQKKYLKYKQKYNQLLYKGGANHKTIQRNKIQTFFPKAISNNALIEKIKSLELNKEKTHCTLSICCDEINHETNDLPDLLKELLGEVFQMGGLGGIPFSGETGLNATLHHVPDDGTLFILYGPHIGISLEGKLGDYNRLGIDHPGHACGAAIGAYNKLVELEKKNQTITELGNNKFDQQFIYIAQELSKLKKEIDSKNNNEKNRNISFAMFKIIQEWIENFKIIFKAQTRIKKLVLIGGIIINVSKKLDTTNNLEDHFWIIKDEIVEL